MVFVGLALGIILLLAGGIGFASASETPEYVVSIALLAAGIIGILSVVFLYSRRNRRKKNGSSDCCEPDIFNLDCFNCGNSRGNRDKGLFDCDSPDCDCTPDCSN